MDPYTRRRRLKEFRKAPKEKLTQDQWEVIRRRQISTALSRIFDNINPNMEPRNKQYLIDQAADIDPAAIKGKNLEILATALMTGGGTITPQQLNNIPENVPYDEVIAYLLFLQYRTGFVQLSTTDLPVPPDWARTWMPVRLMDPPRIE